MPLQLTLSTHFVQANKKTDHSQVDSCIGWLYFILTKVKPVPKLHDHCLKPFISTAAAIQGPIIALISTDENAYCQTSEEIPSLSPTSCDYCPITLSKRITVSASGQLLKVCQNPRTVALEISSLCPKTL